MELRKNIDIQSFYNSVQRLEGHTLISALKKEDINSVINSAKKEIESFFELVRNDFTQRTASDELYNPLFMLKLWDLARTESINYLQKKDKNKCELRYHENGLEYMMWMLSIIAMSWMIKNLKGKIEVGSCHTHRKATGKPCSISSQFHSEIYELYIRTVQTVLDEARDNPPKLVSS